MSRSTIASTVGLLAAGLILSCAEAERPPAEGTPVEAPDSRDKIPITTRSDDAYDLYLAGRNLSDRLRPSEARERYLEALTHDRHFALAHLALANSASTAREFFDSMSRALALTDVVSDGERLMILAQDAAVRGDPAEQFSLLVELAATYPGDERAHALLGGYHFGRQEYEDAIRHYEKAVEIAPEFSPPYNLLGYSYRAQARYEEAERAFLRYIELIPDEPNPYDSYAELLMKVGRFDESIEAYEKALSIKPDFLFSYAGLGNNLMLLDRYDAAREVFAEQFELASNDGQRRNALFWEAMSHVHQGDTGSALSVYDRLYAMAETDRDLAAMAGDLTVMGNILLEAGELDRAEEKFVQAVQLMGDASVPEDVKENTRRNFLYWKTRLEIARGHLADARRQLESYDQQVEKRRIPFELRRVQELEGYLALASDRPAEAAAAFANADQQNPRVLYLTARAHQESGDLPKALAVARSAADFNGLNFNYAFVRQAAQQLVRGLEAGAE